MPNPQFIPGLTLSERFYLELVQPLLKIHFPGLVYSAALIGNGSEVLGFDSRMSMDHAWAPRMQIFLAEENVKCGVEINQMLQRELPTHFLDFPLGTRPSSNDPGLFFMDENTKPGEVLHKVQIGTLREFILSELDWDLREPLTPADWLTFPSQVLRVITAGRVFFDGSGELTSSRQRLAFYPRDIWLYLLACGWDRIGQEEPIMQRAGFAGDELGAAIIASRLVRDAMSLCFLLERQYAPYPKWFGTAFKTLNCATELSPLLWQVQTASTWMERAKAFGAACEIISHKQNLLGLTEALPEKLIPFHDRPFMVINADRFTQIIFQAITDPEVLRIAKKGLLGSLDQFSDNTILRSDSRWRKALKGLFD